MYHSSFSLLISFFVVCYSSFNSVLIEISANNMLDFPRDPVNYIKLPHFKTLDNWTVDFVTAFIRESFININ